MLESTLGNVVLNIKHLLAAHSVFLQGECRHHWRKHEPIQPETLTAANGQRQCDVQLSPDQDWLPPAACPGLRVGCCVLCNTGTSSVCPPRTVAPSNSQGDNTDLGHPKKLNMLNHNVQYHPVAEVGQSFSSDGKETLRH